MYSLQINVSPSEKGRSALSAVKMNNVNLFSASTDTPI